MNSTNDKLKDETPHFGNTMLPAVPSSEVYLEDCVKALKRFNDKLFDLAIVDPPYGIGAAKEKPHNGWKDWGIKEWDNESPQAEYFTELFRVSKNQIVRFGLLRFLEVQSLITKK